MQFITLASAAALIATAAASPAIAATDFNGNSSCDPLKPTARVHNRCPYPVYLWSVLKGLACPSGAAVVVNPGQYYQENYRPAVGDIGTSIKISKSATCDPDALTQLEYFIETRRPGYNYNYLDVSYVNCKSTDAGNLKHCPSATEGYYLKSGNAGGLYSAQANNEICPIFSCNNWEQCSKVSYVDPLDRQTKSCNPNADLDFYMCGGDEPGTEEPETPVYSEPAAPSSTAEEEEVPEPTSTAVETSAYEETEVAAAEITQAPQAPAPKSPKIWTEVVYVTKVEYVNAKRHAHGHSHKHFKA